MKWIYLTIASHVEIIESMEDQTPAIPSSEPVQSQQNNYKWVKTLAIGFSIVSFCVAIGVIGYVLGTRNNQTLQQRANEQNPVIVPSVQMSPAIDQTSNWKTYTNTKYSYLLKYPNDLPAYDGLATSKKDELVGMDTTDSVIFGCSGFDAGVCLPTFKAGKSSLNETQINDIFNLKVDGQTTKGITYTLGGMWNQKTNYIRLADKVVNSINFLVLDNSSGYGGSNRIWFVKKNDTTLQFSCIYTNQNFLNTCQNIIFTFKFTQ